MRTEVYMIMDENEIHWQYDYDYKYIVNSYIRMGQDCTVYVSALPEGRELDDMTVEELDDLDWRYLQSYHA